jgi:hypothetical protein
MDSLLQDFIEPDFHQVNLDIESALKTERGIKLDSGQFCIHDTFHVLLLVDPHPLPDQTIKYVNQT